ncbi:MAG: cbb3-type cytochrome c oxidase subunit II [Anaerolineae bacterium]
MRLSVNTISLPEIALLVLVPIFVVGAVLFSGGTPSARAAAYATTKLRGEMVFNRERCFYCHTMRGREVQQSPSSANRLGPLPLLGWARNGPDLLFEAGKRSDDWHLAHLINPAAVSPGSSMPAYTHLFSADLEALIAFLQEPKGEGGVTASPQVVAPSSVPEVSRNLLTYRAGRAIYGKYCQGCHGLEGNGNGPVGHLLRPEPRDFTNAMWMSKQTDLYLFSVIVNGKPETAMPGYGQVLDAEEEALVLQYIRYYSDSLQRQRMEEGLLP